MSQRVCISSVNGFYVIHNLGSLVPRPMANAAMIMGISTWSVAIPSTGTYCTALALQHYYIVQYYEALLMFSIVVPSFVPMISEIFLLWTENAVTRNVLSFGKVSVISFQKPALRFVQVILGFSGTRPPSVLYIKGAAIFIHMVSSNWPLCRFGKNCFLLFPWFPATSFVSWSFRNSTLTPIRLCLFFCSIHIERSRRLRQVSGRFLCRRFSVIRLRCCCCFSMAS